MDKLITRNIHLVVMALLLMVPLKVSSAAEVGPSDLEGEDLNMFLRFRELFQNGEPKEFYDFAKEYEAHLKSKGHMMLYYKLQNNEGFYALRHHMLYHAMEVAKRLDGELRQDGATDYYYLATGLMADIYDKSHNRNRAEQYFIHALEEVGDRDPKFTMRCYQSLAEIQFLKDSKKALEWLDKSAKMAKETDNVEYLSMSLALTAYVYFVDGNSEAFRSMFEQYQSLRASERPGFSHRYDKIMDIAKMTFDGNYHEAIDKLSQEGTIYVDSSLVAIRIYAMSRDIDNGFAAMKRRYLEMDSAYSAVQDANFNQMATEQSLMRTREEALANKKLAKRLTLWLVGLTAVYVFVYILGRRRLVRKIWAKNRDLKVALAKAEESDRMKSAFIRSMSHEIRTPLNAVSGFSELLCTVDNELTEAEKSDMQVRISDNVKQIISIVNELLELSKSESENTLAEPEKADFACNAICRSVIESLKSETPTGVELRFTTTLSDDFQIHTNEGRLKRALTHVVGNAQKFTENGFIEVHAEQAHHNLVIISVTDTGIGIAEKDRERIFDNISKVDDFKRGVGLGLPICRQLLRSLGGEVELDAGYTSGSRFILTVPVKV